MICMTGQLRIYVCVYGVCSKKQTRGEAGGMDALSGDR